MERKILFIFVLFALVSLQWQWTAAKSFRKMESGLSMVVRARRALRRQKRSVKSAMASMHVKSVVKSRFAKVKIETEMENSEDTAKEMTFSVRLPEAAFISGFKMVVDGLEFVGKVKEKQQAVTQYQGARERGNSAGLVTADVRQTQAFNVAANVPARSSVTFTLIYQELLKRKLGQYEHSIFINPGQLVEDFKVNVFITEQTGITKLETQHPKHAGSDSTGNVIKGYNSKGEVVIETSVRRSKHQALVTFKPSQTQQRRLLMIPEDDRKVTVIYDVTREVLGGELQTRDGYFVHFFAPDDLPVLPKRVVFVIDTSGSMSGKKIEQTKTAFETVLREMSDADEFNIVTFAGSSTVWKNNMMVKVTTDSVNRAVQHVRSMVAAGGTNLNEGILEGSRLLAQPARDERTLSAIIVLTDGDPTVGVTNENQIRQNAKRSIEGRFSLFCLGFGEHLNHDFLKKLANDKNGITRKIYSDSDAHLQLEGFFREVATPLLLNIRMIYSGLNVDKVSKTNVDKYFGGSEIIVVGTMQLRSIVEAQITGMNQDGQVQYTVTSNEVNEDYIHSQEDAGEFSNVIERIWAYFTFKGLLEKKVLAESQAEAQRYNNEALRLALKFGFVTPLTSMVVVTHEDEVTTAASSTITPIPPCWGRDSEIPDNMQRTAIWCPYIFDETTSRRNNRMRQPISSRRLSNTHSTRARHHGGKFSSYSSLARSGGRRAYSARRKQVPPLQAFMRSQPQQRIMAYASRQSSSPRRNMLLMSSYGYTPQRNLGPPRTTTTQRSFAMPPPEDGGHYGFTSDNSDNPVKSNHCGGRFTQASHTITFPSSLADHHDGTVYCDWTVKLRKGSWIDLYIEEMQTDDTKVEITSKSETIYTHSDGEDSAQFISVEANRLKIRMTIDTGRTSQEAIRITYKEFVPVEGVQPAVPGGADESDMQPSFIECGTTILPSDENSGLISSPNYPSLYPARAQCSWNITNDDPDNFRLTLDLVDIDIETDGTHQCSYDKLTIKQAGLEAIDFCGQQNRTIDISSSDVRILFTSDDLMEGSGFKIRYDFVPV